MLAILDFDAAIKRKTVYSWALPLKEYNIFFKLH